MSEALRHDDGAGRYTYADYLTWPDEFRCELIDGEVHDMSPAPSPRRQAIVVNCVHELRGQLKGHRCRLFTAPVDVCLTKPGQAVADSRDVLQPDVLIVCDRGKIGSTGIVGAPDFVIEVLAPGNKWKDLEEKLDRYERHGVREYWIIDPVALTVTARVLGEDGRYGEPRLLDSAGVAELASVPGLKVDLPAIFTDLD